MLSDLGKLVATKNMTDNNLNAILVKREAWWAIVPSP